MLNLHELEQRWLRYKIKSYLPYVVFGVSIAIIFSALLFFLRERTTPIIKKTTPIAKKSTPIKKSKELPEILQEKKTLQSDTQKLLLSPSLSFMKKMQINEMQINEQPHYKIKKVHTVTVVQKDIQKRQKIQITHQNTYGDIAEVISRFKKNNNPALSLFVAKKYYELGDYRQAYNYALITNQINQDIEVSWIIFTKSLVKLGKKEQAIKTLHQYIKQSHSNSAQILLDAIISGKFR